MKIEEISLSEKLTVPCMQFSTPKRHAEIQEESQEFADTVLKSNFEKIRGSSPHMPDKVVAGLAANGWFGLLIPKEYGGRGLDCLARILNVQYVTRGCPDAGAVLQIAQLGTGSFIEYGSEQQKRTWLPLLATGERIATIAITEEHSGSHILGMSTTYEERDGVFILEGEKSFIGNCPISNLHVVYAREKEGKRLSAFIVEGERSGVDNTNQIKTEGLRAFPFGKLKLNGVKVPRGNVLGELGQGQEIAYRIIAHHGRPSLTALALGIHHRILDLSYAFSENRKLYGKSIRAIPDVKFKLFDIYQRFEMCRLSAYEAAHLEGIGGESFRALSWAKYINGENVCQSAVVAADIFGARAGIAEFEIGQLTLDAMMTRPPSGTGDVQRKRILEDIFSDQTKAWKK